jgi:hypothetical protein
MSYKSIFKIKKHHRLFQHANCPGNIKHTTASFHYLCRNLWWKSLLMVYSCWTVSLSWSLHDPSSWIQHHHHHHPTCNKHTYMINLTKKHGGIIFLKKYSHNIKRNIQYNIVGSTAPTILFTSKEPDLFILISGFPRISSASFILASSSARWRSCSKYTWFQINSLNLKNKPQH